MSKITSRKKDFHKRCDGNAREDSSVTLKEEKKKKSHSYLLRGKEEVFQKKKMKVKD